MYVFFFKNLKCVLCVIRKYVDLDKIVRLLIFFDVLKCVFKGKNRDNYLK